MESVLEKGIAYCLKVPGNSESTVIGVKRFGGLYCTKCEVSLLKEGEEAARYAGKVYSDCCPLCDVKIADGKASGQFINCSCFEWNIGPHRLHQRNLQSLQIVDSFGDEYSVERFLAKVVSCESCPIQFYDQITNN